MSSTETRDPIQPLALLTQSDIVTATSLNLPAGISDDDFRQLCVWLGGLRDWSAWAIGDAILHAERISDDFAAEIVELLGRAKSTCAKWRWLCDAYRPNQRIDGVSPTHHELVATLKAGERRALLLQAKRERLSVEEFRGIVRPDTPAPTRIGEVPVGATVEVRLSDGKHEMAVGTATMQADGTAMIKQIDTPAVIDSLPTPLARAWRAAVKAAEPNGNGRVSVPVKEWHGLVAVLGG